MASRNMRDLRQSGNPKPTGEAPDTAADVDDWRDDDQPAKGEGPDLSKDQPETPDDDDGDEPSAKPKP